MSAWRSTVRNMNNELSLSLSLIVIESNVEKPGKPQRNPRRKEGKSRKRAQKPKMSYQKPENELQETKIELPEKGCETATRLK